MGLFSSKNLWVFFNSKNSVGLPVSYGSGGTRIEMEHDTIKGKNVYAALFIFIDLQRNVFHMTYYNFL